MTVRHMHVHMHDYGPGQNPASHQHGPSHLALQSRGWKGEQHGYSGNSGTTYTHASHPGHSVFVAGMRGIAGRAGNVHELAGNTWEHHRATKTAFHGSYEPVAGGARVGSLERHLKQFHGSR